MVLFKAMETQSTAKWHERLRVQWRSCVKNGVSSSLESAGEPIARDRRMYRGRSGVQHSQWKYHTENASHAPAIAHDTLAHSLADNPTQTNFGQGMRIALLSWQMGSCMHIVPFQSWSNAPRMRAGKNRAILSVGGKRDCRAFFQREGFPPQAHELFRLSH